MFLFKAAGSTYRQVVRRAAHAFPPPPKDAPPGQFVLLSKNREDCRPTEQQIQYVAKLLEVREATPEELERDFPGVDAAQRWKYRVHLYWARPLDRPFSLSLIDGVDSRRYDAVQNFARLDEGDERLVFAYLCKWNGPVLLDFINNA
ncbi:MAG: hypothetical protein ACYCVE_16170, partial [Gemmatimonadaceae bacterium]